MTALRHLTQALILGLLAGGFLHTPGLAQTGPDSTTGARYAQLFQAHCLSRLQAYQAGRDPFAALPKDAQDITQDPHSQLQITQSHHNCQVSDKSALMSPQEREKATAQITHILSERLPQLTHPGAQSQWDYFFSRVRFDPQGPMANSNWGVIVMRIQAATGDALQATTTVLSLPRN